MTLPLQEALVGAKPVNLSQDNTLTGEMASLENRKFLVVDDHPVNLMFIKKLFKKMGMNDVDSADDGRMALEMMLSNEYDIVFMDCQMPEMDGYTATQMLREAEQATGKHMPIIAMTANAMVGDREKCLTAGMDDYISKPIEFYTLIKVMNRALLNKGSDNSSLIAEPQIEVTGASKEECSEGFPVDLNHLQLYTEGNLKEEKEISDMFFSIAEETVASLRL